MRWIRNWATPLATATMLAVGVSGVMMFFKVGERQVKELHEWFGIALVLAVVLHVVRNWSAFKGWFSRSRSMFVSLGIAAVVAAVMVGAASFEGEGGRASPRAAFQLLEGGTVTELAPLVDKSPAELAKAFEDAGFSGVSEGATVREIAEASETSPPEVLATLTGLSGS